MSCAQYFAGLMTSERRADLTFGEGEYGGGGAYREIVRQLGADGWLTPRAGRLNTVAKTAR